MVINPVTITVYQDVLCAWGYLAELRLEPLEAELGANVRWNFRPFPLRARSMSMTCREKQEWIDEINRARLENDGGQLKSDLWLQNDCPTSSLRPLLAVEAAGLQGERSRRRMTRALQRAALEQGINVTRMDVILELASALGLDVDRFSMAWVSTRLRRMILAERGLARERGVTGVPTLVVAGRWMICGLRETLEYRRYILMCLKKDTERRAAFERVVH
jgi:predicted DsbA family dithiol-disulfide isomerase